MAAPSPLETLFLAVSANRADIVSEIVRQLERSAAEGGPDAPGLGLLSQRRGADGFTPLHLACASGHIDCLRALLAADADPTVRDAQGRRPWDVLELGETEDAAKTARCREVFEMQCMQLISQDKVAQLRRILEGGVRGDARINGDTLLHWCAIFEKPEAAAGILEVERQKPGGSEAVAALLRCANHDSQTPLQVAEAAEAEELVQLLRNWKANPAGPAANGQHGAMGTPQNGGGPPRRGSPLPPRLLRPGSASRTNPTACLRSALEVAEPAPAPASTAATHPMATTLSQWLDPRPSKIQVLDLDGAMCRPAGAMGILWLPGTFPLERPGLFLRLSALLHAMEIRPCADAVGRAAPCCSRVLVLERRAAGFQVELLPSCLRIAASSGCFLRQALDMLGQLLLLLRSSEGFPDPAQRPASIFRSLVTAAPIATSEPLLLPCLRLAWDARPAPAPSPALLDPSSPHTMLLFPPGDAAYVPGSHAPTVPNCPESLEAGQMRRLVTDALRALHGAPAPLVLRGVVCEVHGLYRGLPPTPAAARSPDGLWLGRWCRAGQRHSLRHRLAVATPLVQLCATVGAVWRPTILLSLAGGSGALAGPEPGPLDLADVLDAALSLAAKTQPSLCVKVLASVDAGADVVDLPSLKMLGRDIVQGYLEALDRRQQQEDLAVDTAGLLLDVLELRCPQLTNAAAARLEEHLQRAFGDEYIRSLGKDAGADDTRLLEAAIMGISIQVVGGGAAAAGAEGDANDTNTATTALAKTLGPGTDADPDPQFVLPHSAFPPLLRELRRLLATATCTPSRLGWRLLAAELVYDVHAEEAFRRAAPPPAPLSPEIPVLDADDIQVLRLEDVIGAPAAPNLELPLPPVATRPGAPSAAMKAVLCVPGLLPDAANAHVLRRGSPREREMLTSAARLVGSLLEMLAAHDVLCSPALLQSLDPKPRSLQDCSVLLLPFYMAAGPENLEAVLAAPPQALGLDLPSVRARLRKLQRGLRLSREHLHLWSSSARIWLRDHRPGARDAASGLSWFFGGEAPPPAAEADAEGEAGEGVPGPPPSLWVAVHGAVARLLREMDAYEATLQLVRALGRTLLLRAAKCAEDARRTQPRPEDAAPLGAVLKALPNTEQSDLANKVLTQLDALMHMQAEAAGLPPLAPLEETGDFDPDYRFGYDIQDAGLEKYGFGFGEQAAAASGVYLVRLLAEGLGEGAQEALWHL